LDDLISNQTSKQTDKLTTLQKEKNPQQKRQANVLLDRTRSDEYYKVLFNFGIPPLLPEAELVDNKGTQSIDNQSDLYNQSEKSSVRDGFRFSLNYGISLAFLTLMEITPATACASVKLVSSKIYRVKFINEFKAKGKNFHISLPVGQ
jgi:hypothetical protein